MNDIYYWISTIGIILLWIGSIITFILTINYPSPAFLSGLSSIILSLIILMIIIPDIREQYFKKEKKVKVLEYINLKIY